MKLELPDDHPIAETIRQATMNGWNDHLFLSLDSIGPQGHRRLMSMRVDSWTLTEVKTKHLEISMVDWQQERTNIERMRQWPTI